jgi:hypothetical protein
VRRDKGEPGSGKSESQDTPYRRRTNKKMIQNKKIKSFEMTMYYVI